MGDRSFDYPTGQYSNSRGYELSGKIMLTAIIVLFFIVFLMVCFHLYLRCYVLRTRRHHSRTRRRTRRTNLVFYVDNNSGGGGAQSRGLDAAVLKSLPVFVFSGETRPEEPLECAVCLSEFEENETGRTLPKCNHSFHIGCIDMWFDSHSTCPLCRSAVEPADSRAEFSVSVAEPDPVEPGSGSGCPGCDSGSAVATTSFGKPGEIQIPVRDKIFGRSEEESPAAASAQSFRSPVSRMMSFKRILSRDRRGPASPSSSCGGAAEPDIECGGAEEARRA